MVYRVKRRCDHVDRIDASDRPGGVIDENEARWLANTVCKTCFFQTKNAEDIELAAQFESRNPDLKAIRGVSQKQVTYARIVRAKAHPILEKLIGRLMEEYGPAPPLKGQVEASAVLALLECDVAATWITYRHHLGSLEEARAFIQAVVQAVGATQPRSRTAGGH